MPVTIWNRAGSLQCAVGNQVVRQHHVAGVEDLELGQRARRVHARGHHLDAARRVDHGTAAEPLRVEVEGADLGLELDHMLGANLRRGQHRARPGLGRLVVAGDEAAAGAGGEIDDEVGIAATDALHHLAVVFELHAGLAGVGLAHVDMADGGPCLGGTDAGVGDFLRRDGQVGIVRARRERAGDGAGENGRFHRLSQASLVVPALVAGIQVIHGRRSKLIDGSRAQGPG